VAGDAVSGDAPLGGGSCEAAAVASPAVGPVLTAPAPPAPAFVGAPLAAPFVGALLAAPLALQAAIAATHPTTTAHASQRGRR
jgi:hypothetical protein